MFDIFKVKAISIDPQPHNQYHLLLNQKQKYQNGISKPWVETFVNEIVNPQVHYLRTLFVVILRCVFCQEVCILSFYVPIYDRLSSEHVNHQNTTCSIRI